MQCLLRPWLIMLIAVCAATAQAQIPGLDEVRPVGPFLNGTLPTQSPLDPSSSGWTTTNVFNNVWLNLTTAIEPNPYNDRLFIGSRRGYIKSLVNDPDTSSVRNVMDFRDKVAMVNDGGLLGLAFHPEYGQSGSVHEKYVYIYYSTLCGIVGPHPTRPGDYEMEGEFTEDDGAGGQQPVHPCKPASELPTTFAEYQNLYFFDTYLRLSRFEVNLSTDAIDPESEVVLLNLRLFNGSHRGGGLEFGDDGYLWLTIGDQFRYETAQTIDDNLEGGILRLDVDIVDHGDGTWSCPGNSHQPRRLMDDVSTANDFASGVYEEISGKYYCIPDDNPWLDSAGSIFEEYATVGHRNPHRLTKDSLTGRLWSAEVGQNKREEVNVIEAGQNNGWPFREGSITGVRPEPASYVGTLTDPVIDFDRADANAIIGGYVYRGSKFPELYGKYMAGDYVTEKIWAITLDEASMTATADQVATFSPGGLGTWGETHERELLLGSAMTWTNSVFALERMGEPQPDAPALLSSLGVFDDLPSFDVADFMVPYDLIQPFWSDGALKQRWIALPNDGTRDTAEEQIAFSADSNWTYPVGTVLMKHFELALDETDPAVTARLETRFLVHGDDGDWYGLTYRWRPDLSDADLLTSAETQSYTIQLEDGGSRQQEWLFPSRDQCRSCHTEEAGGAVGPRTHQMNNTMRYAETGLDAHQLLTWSHLGMFDMTLDQAAVDALPKSVALEDPTASLELRSRSWIDSNCSYCHRPETGRAVFDARLTTPLENQQLIYGFAADTYGLPDAHIVTPGEPESSVLHIRMASTDLDAMPPLAKALAEQPAVEVLSGWIERISTELVVNNGLFYDYYETGQLSALPDFDSLVPSVSGNSPNFDINLRLRDDDFALRFRGKIHIAESGDYTFYVNSSEGSQLFINTGIVVDNDGLHDDQEQSGLITLPAGYHDIEVTMFERDGEEALGVQWQGPGFAKQPVPDGALFLEEPTPASNEAPVLDAVSNPSFVVGESPSFFVTATDNDGDSLFYSARGLPSGLSIDSGSGEISGQIPIGAAGIYDVVIGVSDGPDVDFEEVSWTVEDRALLVDVPEFLLSYTDDTPLVNITAVGGAGQTYSAIGLPDALSIDSVTGEISGTVTADDAGLNVVDVMVDDGSYSDSATFSWLVLLSFPGDLDLDGMPDQYEVENNLNALVDDSAGDPDGDGITNIDEYLQGTDPNSSDLTGDLNDNGMVDLGDVFLLQQHLLGLNELQGNALANADVYPVEGGGDGEVTLADQLELINRLMNPN